MIVVAVWLKWVYLLSVACGMSATAWLFANGNTSLFTWDNMQLQAVLGFVVQVFMIAETSSVLWVHALAPADAVAAVQVFVLAQAAYQLFWALFVVAQHSEHLFLQLTLPIMGWSFSQATALVALFFVGSSTGASAWFVAVLVMQVLVTDYTVVLDGYLYLGAMLRREGSQTRLRYAMWCRNVLCLLCIGILVAFLMARHNQEDDPASVACTPNWTCPFLEPDGVNMRVATEFANMADSINYDAVAVVSHVINFGMPVVVVAGLALAGEGMKMLLLPACVGAAVGAAFVAKYSTHRQRPAVHFNLTHATELANKPDSDQWASFFSGDTAVCASAAMFAVLHLCERSCFGTAIAVFLTALTGCLLRIAAMMHWTTDVATGIAVGGLAGMLFGPNIVALRE